MIKGEFVRKVAEQFWSKAQTLVQPAGLEVYKQQWRDAGWNVRTSAEQLGSAKRSDGRAKLAGYMGGQRRQTKSAYLGTEPELCTIEVMDGAAQ